MNKLVLILLSLLLNTSLWAEIKIVPTEYSTIQAAIDASVVGDTVLVLPGTYFENLIFNGQAIVVGSNFIVTGDTSFISQTIIDGGGTGHVVLFNSGEDSLTVFSGFTIVNGDAPGNGSFQTFIGGGILCDSASPRLSNLRIKNNHAISGGGIALWQSSEPIIENSWIGNNTADDDGGGIYCSSELYPIPKPLIKNSKIINNIAGVDGGGIYSFKFRPIIMNSIIRGNQAMEGGGVSYSTAGLGNKLTITNSIIDSNVASIGGGGIAVSGTTRVDIINSTIVRNIAEGNEGLRTGGGIWSGWRGLVILMNTILWNNEPEQISPDLESENTVIFHSNIQNGIEGIIDNNLIWGDGNFDLNPEFVNEMEGDFYLSSTSPNLEGGVDSVYLDLGEEWLFAPVTDLEGNVRPDPVDTRPDIGAYESSFDRPDNFSPVISNVEDVILNEGIDIFNIRLEAFDLDGDDMIFDGRSDTSAISLEISDDILSLTPLENWLGNSIIKIFVTDGILSDSTDFLLTITPIKGPQPFRLIYPTEEDSFSTVTDTPIIFKWEPSVSVGSEVEYELILELDFFGQIFSSNYTGISDTTFQVLASTLDPLLNGLNLERAELVWTVAASDGEYSTVSDNGSLILIRQLVSISEELLLPKEFELSNNYPNPFNPITTIRYALPKSGDVTLMIYNLRGENVARLVNGIQQAGNYIIKWDASNVSSGIYFYRLQAGDFVQTRKMLLLK